MTEIKVTSHEIEYRYDGVFDLDLLYKNIQTWFAKNKYQFDEKLHKFKPPELELEFESIRKNTGYRKTLAELKFHFWYYKDVVVKVGDKEKKMVSSAYKLKMKITQVYDYNNEYNTSFKKSLQKFLHKFIWFYKINIIWDGQAYDELEDLYALIKKTMNATARN